MNTSSIPQVTTADIGNIFSAFDGGAPRLTQGTAPETPPNDTDTPPNDTGDAGDAPPPGYWRTQRYTLGEFLQRPSKVWLVDKVIGARDFCLLYGESGHGKTHVAIDLAFACATGRTFADTFAVSRQLTVAYATGEGVGGLADRLRGVAQRYGVDADTLPLYLYPDIPQLFESAVSPYGALHFLREWQAAAQANEVPAQLDILILDTLHNASSGADENSAQDAGIVQATMRRLRDELGCTIILLHHAGKNGTSERGSSAIRASADTVLRCTKLGSLMASSSNKYTLSCEKLKDGVAWPAQQWRLDKDSAFTERVFVRWDGVAESDTGDAGDTSRQERRILAFLDSHPDTHYTANELTQELKLSSVRSVQGTLAELRRADSVRYTKEDRTFPDNTQRAVNVYWRESPAQAKSTPEAESPESPVSGVSDSDSDSCVTSVTPPM